MKVRGHFPTLTRVIRHQWGNQTMLAIKYPNGCQGIVLLESRRLLERVEIGSTTLIRVKRGAEGSGIG